MVSKSKIILTFFILFNTFLCVNAAVFNPIENHQPAISQANDTVVFTIFNKENFYVAENTLSINKEMVKVSNNKITTTNNIVYFVSKTSESKVCISLLTPNKKLKEKNKIYTQPITVSKSPNIKNKYAPFDHFPANENLLVVNSLNSRIVPSKPRFFINTHFFSGFENNPYRSNINSIKHLFQTSETIFTKNICLSSSRTRPPPVV
jgi:hypothetical protein